MAKSSRYTFPVTAVGTTKTFPAPVGGIVPSTTGEDHGAMVIPYPDRDSELAKKRYKPLVKQT